MRGFSFASVILSYFLVGGGLFAGLLLIGIIKPQSEIVGYVLMAAGTAIGGFIAGRASKGETVLEPMIGALAVIATIVGLAAGTAAGKLVWHNAQDTTMRFVAAVGLASALGAVVGAFVSEKMFGEATLSSVPWIIYAGFATFGACVLATIVAALLFIQSGTTAEAPHDAVKDLGKLMLAGIGIGCLLSGLAVGASARTRPLLASLVGGGLGVAGYFYLLSRDAHDKDATTGILVLGAGGALVTMIGTLVGWITVGKQEA